MEQNKEKNRSATLRNKLSFCEILKGINHQSRSMRSKLMIYLCCLVLAGTGILLVMLVASGVFSESGRQIEQNLQVHLQNQERDIKDRMDLFATNGIDLSKRLTIYLEREVLSYPYDIKELENDGDKLRKMQENMYMLLEGKLHVTRASGVYAAFDTTVNTSAPNAEYSRSGVYLRLANVSGNVLEDDVFLFRGNPNVAMQNKIQIHNRWNMEFNTEDMYWFNNQVSTGSNKAATEEYLWINRQHLKDTWENSIFLSVPVIGSEGKRYGICGLEISGLLFRLSYPKFESKYGDMVTIIAPVDQEKLLLSEGLSGSQGNSYINENDDLFIDTGKIYNVYSNSQGKYIGVQQTIEGAFDQQGRQWVIAILVSYGSFEAQERYEKIMMIAILMVFSIVMFIISLIISRQFVKPIEKGIENLKTDDFYKNDSRTGIAEIDILAEFLKSKEEKYKSMGAVPSEIEEMFDRFIKNSKELTASERNILEYYVNGYEIAELPDLLCISLNTVRKHNRNIYTKLEVNSKDELQIYIDLLVRCGRINEILK
ncbi:helix-turn-helix transcriptional regulator [Lachnoanaerobaculum gingivalis]|jgi:hypothetical protein|uniref:LuxR family transcriptional regulator n=1 Tax=Lachnoanaerobaculum gingivalis TaxID=2490855 RepID=A0A3P3QVA6_9FIRM|nr:helix-turn-helix transcriptional regulator [Lachnoanaerobaculum gingivalis]RRJ24708.1 LuxR family transcriptional regulator [Lachnoanaerobaculum gingivalis]